MILYWGNILHVIIVVKANMLCTVFFFQDPAASSTSEADADTKGETVAMNYKPSPLQVQIGITTSILQITQEKCVSAHLPEATKACMFTPAYKVTISTNILFNISS